MDDKQIRTVIVEDNIQNSELLMALLSKHAPNISVVSVLDNFTSAYNYLSENIVDLVFLDVELGPNYGPDIIRQLPEIDFKIIVTTAYDKYAIEAFKINAIHFLLKPISADSLIDALERVESAYESDLNKLLDVDILKPKAKRIQVSTDDGIYFINPKDITCIQADGSYSVIRTSSGQKLIVSHLLKKYDHLLSDPTFYRVSRSAIINLRYLVRYKKHQGGGVELIDGTEIVIPRRKRENFGKYLNQVFSTED